MNNTKRNYTDMCSPDDGSIFDSQETKRRKGRGGIRVINLRQQDPTQNRECMLCGSDVFKAEGAISEEDCTFHKDVLRDTPCAENECYRVSCGCYVHTKCAIMQLRKLKIYRIKMFLTDVKQCRSSESLDVGSAVESMWNSYGDLDLDFECCYCEDIVEIPRNLVEKAKEMNREYKVSLSRELGGVVWDACFGHQPIFITN